MNENSEMKKQECSNNLLDNEECNPNIILHMTLFRKKEVYAGYIKCSNETLQNLT